MKKRVMCFVGAVLAAGLVQAGLVEQELKTGWTFAREPDVAAGTKGAWHPAVVPGTVLTSYLRAGLIEDPDFDDNIRKLDEKYYNVDYRYRTTFTVGEKLKGGRLWLEFDGVNWKAEVTLNGKKLGRIDGAFTRGRFDVTDVVRDGANDLDVKILWCEAGVPDMPSFLCTKSWDFMPAIPGRDVGIYKGVRLVKTGDVTLRDACVAIDLPLPDTSKAEARVRVVATNAGRAASEGVLSALITEPHGRKAKIPFRQTFTLAAGETRELVLDPVTLEKPALWWPVGLGQGRGDRPLYEVTLSYEANGATSDTAATRFGVRKFEYEYSPDGKKGDLIVKVNGRRVLCRGGNWAVPDNLLAWTKQDFDDAVEMHRDMGFNMIRTWHGCADFDAFYAACDRCGVMVYEDFWLNGWELPNDRAMFVANLKDKVLRLRSHASLAIWCGENEATPPGWCAKEIPAAVASDPEKRLYVPSSNSGVVSGGITYSIQDPGWFYGKAEKFCTESGAITVPTYRSMQRMMRPENLTLKAIGNKVWDLKGWNFGVGNKQVDTYRRVIGTRYGKPENFARFCELAQYVNYESYKFNFEAWNGKMYDPATGILLWMSNPTWGTILWQVYDAYKAPTGGYYGSKSACEDVHVQWSPLSGDVQAINHTARALAGTVEGTVYDLDGTVLHTFKKSVKAAANAPTTVANFLGMDGGTNLATGGGKATDGNFNTRWTGKTDRDVLEVDLGGLESVDHAVVYWENAYASAYDVELSADGETWTKVAKIDAADGGNDLLPFAPQKARKARLVLRGRGTMWEPSVYEFKVLAANSLKGRIPGKGPVAFIALTWCDTKGKLLSRNFYWTGRQGTDYTAIAQMPQQEVKMSVSPGKAAGARRTLKVTLENPSKVCAVGIWLDLLKAEPAAGEEPRVLPAWWSENVISLAPGERRTVEVSYQGDRPVKVEGKGLNCRVK